MCIDCVQQGTEAVYIIRPVAVMARLVRLCETLHCIHRSL